MSNFVILSRSNFETAKFFEYIFLPLLSLNSLAGRLLVYIGIVPTYYDGTYTMHVVYIIASCVC